AVLVSGGTVNFGSNNLTFSSLNISGGKVATTTGTLTSSGLFTFSGGTLSATTLANGGIDFHGSSDVFQDGGSLTNASGQNATMGASGNVALGMLDGATFTNAGTLTGSGGAQFFNDGGAASTVANSGTLNVTGSLTVGSG